MYFWNLFIEPGLGAYGLERLHSHCLKCLAQLGCLPFQLDHKDIKKIYLLIAILSSKYPLMFKRLLLFAVGISTSLSVSAQTPVWSTDVAPILYSNCVSCHRTGGAAPFELITYQNAVTYSSLISSAVQAKRMPPWPPDPAYKALAHERLLTQAQISTIANWVNGGAPQGNPNLAPPAPVFNSNGDLPGTPSLVATIPTYTSAAATGDIYQCFVVPSGLLADKFITAFEAIPGNRSIVHHVLVYSDTSGTCAALDAATPGPGYTSFGGVGASDAELVGGWVPGTAPLQYPAGFGVKLAKGTDIVIQIHYPAGTMGMVDSTKINFFFSPTNNVRSVAIVPVLNHQDNAVLQNYPLFIGANQTKTFVEKFTPPAFFNYSVLGIAPHMHLIGKNIKSFGVTPTLDTQQLISIPNWDFHWQGFYMFKKIQKVVAGTTLYAVADYDNTANNPMNPNNPPQPVSAGESTTDEMMLVYYIFTLYQPGDENIVIDSSTITSVLPVNYYHGQQLLQSHPNPATNELVVKCYLEKEDNGSIDIINMEGRLVKTLMAKRSIKAGYTPFQFSVADLPSGIYQLRLRTSERVLTQKLLVQH